MKHSTIQSASVTACKNCLVRSSFGFPKISSGVPCFAHLALVEEADPVGNLPGKAHFVRDHQHGQVVLFGQLADDVEHLADQFRIERRGRLVEQHDPRPHGERAGDADALLLAAGKLVAGTCWRGRASPTSSSSSSARARRFLLSTSRAPRAAPRSRLRSTVMCGNRLNCWNTMPSFVRILRRCASPRRHQRAVIACSCQSGSPST